jgi:RNA polymerase sigma factor (sigma-70 family)
LGQLRRLWRAGCQIGAIDTGAFVLAEAGILGRETITLHWEAAAEFRRRFPRIPVSNELYERHARLMTCAGGTAAIDLMLDGIADSHGIALAQAVSDQLIHDRIRPPTAPQRVAPPVLAEFAGPVVQRLVAAMERGIGEGRSLAAILTEALGREPTDEELADEIGVPRRKLAMLRQASHRPTSLDAPINEGEATEYSEVISDDRAVNPLDMLADKNLHGELDGLLSVLDERERKIIDERFGLSGRRALTLEEVGREFGVTRERIRQIESKTMSKLRHPSRSQVLRDYLD